MSIASDVRIILGKSSSIPDKQYLDPESLSLVLDPKDILIPVDYED